MVKLSRAKRMGLVMFGEQQPYQAVSSEVVLHNINKTFIVAPFIFTDLMYHS